MKNVAKAGQTIPIKWQVLDFNGYPVSEASHFVKVLSQPGAGCVSDPGDVIEVYSGDSGLQYFGDGYWQVNWKTPKSYAGQCRIMTLDLVGSPDYKAEFLFK